MQSRLEDLNRRIEMLDSQRESDDSVEVTALLEQLTRERSDVAEALRDATLIDDEPFDTKAIEVGDTVTIRDHEGATDRYVLVDSNVRYRAQDDWVSVASPLGAALLGRSKGEEFHVDSPSGTTSYVIIEFERTSDDSIVLAASGHSTSSRELLPSETFIG